MGLLDDILREKRAHAAELRARPRATARPKGWEIRDVPGALRRPAGGALRLIGEIKFRSPSAGPLSRRLAAGERALAYERGGAAMVSVLTDSTWFGGSFDDLRAARELSALPLLCKDFLIDAAQLEPAWAAGADAVLVIARCLPGDSFGAMLEGARGRGLEPLVEVVDEAEVDRAVAAGARVIGVNARDLDTLQMDPRRAARVLERIPPDRVAVHFSGVKGAADTAAIARSRADAALVGEALMRADNPASILGELTRGAALREGS